MQSRIYLRQYSYNSNCILNVKYTLSEMSTLMFPTLSLFLISLNNYYNNISNCYNNYNKDDNGYN